MEARLGELTRSIQQRQPPGHEFIKYCWSLAKHSNKRDGVLSSALEESKRFVTAPNAERVLMAAVGAGTTSSPGWAQELGGVYQGLTRHWIDNVTRLSVLGKLRFTPVPFLKKAILETGAFSAGWVEQSQPIPFSRATLSTPPMLLEKKVGAICPFDSELFEFWSPAVQANFQDAIQRAVLFAMDFQLLDPAVTETAARPASLLNGVVPTQSTGPSGAQALADVNAMLGSLLVSKGADPSRILIVMSPSSALFLSQVLTSGGNFAFPFLNAATGGTVLGFPVAVCSAAAQTGSPSSNFIAALAGDRILVADDGLILVEASAAASLQFSDAPASGPTSTVSLFQTGTHALKMLRFLNYERASANAAAWFPVAY